MTKEQSIWLIENQASGSNDERAVDALRGVCTDAGFHIAHRSSFPLEDLPRPELLDAAGIKLVTVFTGDGTINAAIEALAGWDGAVLVLPGGTMNLLYHRLHGDRTIEEVVEAAATGKTRRVRPKVITCPEGDALAGLLAGPGTSWNDVREDMRNLSVAQMMEHAADAIDRTLSEPGVACREPAMGRPEGYPLLMLNPLKEGIEVTEFHSDTVGEFLTQGWALLRRNFREGPHEVLGTVPEVLIENTSGKPYGILVDGEPAEVPARTRFVLAECKVDLLATEPDEF